MHLMFFAGAVTVVMSSALAELNAVFDCALDWCDMAPHNASLLVLWLTFVLWDHFHKLRSQNTPASVVWCQ